MRYRLSANDRSYPPPAFQGTSANVVVYRWPLVRKIQFDIRPLRLIGLREQSFIGVLLRPPFAVARPCPSYRTNHNKMMSI